MREIKSIGLIETIGMVGAVEAADAALKAANVTLLGYEFNGAGYVVIKLTGDVAAVQAAVSSGGATAKRLGNLVATHVIARPDEQVIEREIKSPDNVPPFDPPEGPADPEPKTLAKPGPEKPAPEPAAKPAAKAPDKPAAKPAPKSTGKTKPKGKK